MNRSRRAALAIGAGVLAFIAVAVLVVVHVTRGASPPPETFGPWYPVTNDAGDPAFADFENHVPCALDNPPMEDCQRVKLGIVFYRDATTGEPTTYLISIIRVGVSDDRETHEGTWSIGAGTGLDSEAPIFVLDAGAPEHLSAYWSVGDDILFLLDDRGMPRVGDAAYGYALNRIPIG